jgi:homoserine dehydrogenase
MKNKKKVKIGILGLGEVGSELVSQVQNNKSRIEQETGKTVEIEYIYVRSLTKTRNINTSNLNMTNNILEILDNPKIDIICECIGGNGFNETKNYLLQAINNGKHIVMSSKKALAVNSEELLQAAFVKNIQFKYDASVGGGIPIAKVLDQSFKGDHVLKISGIFNATSNFIYSKMQNENLDYIQALKLAQQKGYEENDPSDDIDGIDSKNKLVILTIFGMQMIVPPSALSALSFKNIEFADMNYASELGFRIKPLATLKAINAHYEYFIGPCLVCSDHIFASTENNFNSIIIEGENSGEIGFYGQGAGGKPTATAMFDDLINILKNPDAKNNWSTAPFPIGKLRRLETPLYWRILIKNKFDVQLVSQFFTDTNISVKKLIYKNENELVIISESTKIEILENLKENIKNSGYKLECCLPIIA